MKRSMIVPVLLSLFFACSIFLLPGEAVLAQTSFPSPDSGAQGNLVPCSGTDCQFCHFIELGNNVLGWLFTIVFIIFSILIFVAGFQLVTSAGNQSALDGAKKKLSNALIGIIIIFCAWLIVDTLLKAVLPNGQTQLGPWNEIQCFSNAQSSPQQTNSQTTTNVITDANGNPVVFQSCTDQGDGTEICSWTSAQQQNIPGATCNQISFTPPAYNCFIQRPINNGGVTSGSGPAPGEASSRALVQANGISVNNPGCPANMTYQQYRAANGSGCTSVAGLNPALIDAAARMRNECGSACSNFVITGGTEAGHANCSTAGAASCSIPGSHSAGDKIDLGVNSNPGISNYINDDRYFSDGTQGSGGRPARVNNATGVSCVLEGTHWDCLRPLP